MADSLKKQRTYIAIDLKSFYASVECVERGLNPLTANLVVADQSRTEKTICLAVSPSLKSYGIPGRARLFEVIQKVREVNKYRLNNAIRSGVLKKNEQGICSFASSSFDSNALANDLSLELSYITAPPRMQTYMDYSTRIYNIYLKYVSSADIHVYSIDEVFIDVTSYLSLYRMTARELCMTIIRDILFSTGITATGGIGTNLYLAKIAMDIVAKHVPADKDGVRIAELDEMSYRRQLWEHTPLTDFWRVGRGYEKKLNEYGLFTMGDIARCSIGKSEDYYNEELLYKLFGVNAELLIDHAWGWEPTTIDLIKAYRPQTNSISSGQVLHCPYDYEAARLIVREMTDILVLSLVEKKLVTNQIVLTIGYDKDSLSESKTSSYKGEIVTDRYGRRIPKHAHGTINLNKYSSSTKLILEKTTELYERIIDKELLVRRINITANNIVDEQTISDIPQYEQLDLFTDYSKLEQQRQDEAESAAHEKNLQHAMINIKNKFGKNSIVKGMNLQKDGTAMQRNKEIGGHKA